MTGFRYPIQHQPSKPEPKPKPTECRFCGKYPPYDDLGLCIACGGYRDRQDPPSGGKAAGMVFEDEPEMALAVGGRR